MKNITWNIFDTEITEDYELHFVEQTSTEDSFSVTDMIRDVFYIDTLKKLNSDVHFNLNYDQCLDNLNSLWYTLSHFFKKSKQLFHSLETTYSQISQLEPNESVVDPAMNFVIFVYDFLKNPNSDFFQQCFEAEQIIITRLSSELHSEILLYFKDLNKYLEQYIQQQNISIRNQIYYRIRKLPKYLGQVYFLRYNLYKKIIQYPKAHQRIAPYEAPDFTVVQMLLNTHSFDKYFNSNYQKIITNIELQQKNACKITTITDPTTFDDTITALLKAIHSTNIPKKYKDNSGYGCFSLTEVHTSKNTYELISFSGITDATDTIIKDTFDFHSTLNVSSLIALLKTLPRFQNSHLLFTNQNVRFYYNDTEYITLKEFCNSSIAQTAEGRASGRMFSCCERKFFSYIPDTNDIIDYTMFSRFNPCELCKPAINDYQKKLNGTIIYGEYKDPIVKNSEEYYKLAMRIKQANSCLATP